MSLLHDVLEDLERRKALPEGVPRPADGSGTPVRSRASPVLAAVAGISLITVVALGWAWFATTGLDGESAAYRIEQPTLASSAPAASATDPMTDPTVEPTLPTASGGPAIPQRASRNSDDVAGTASVPIGAEDSGSDASSPLVESFAAAEPSRPAGPLVPRRDAPPSAATEIAARTTEAAETPATTGESRANGDGAEAIASGEPEETSAEAGGPDARTPRIEIRRSDGASVRREPAERARLALGRGRPDQARTLLTAAIRGDEPMVEERLLLSRLLIASGDAGTARRVLEDGLVASSGDLRLVEALARHLLDADDPAQAARMIEAYSPPLSSGVEVHLLWAAALHRIARHREAGQRYAAILDQQPDQAQAWLGLALSMDARARYEEAADAYRRAAELGAAEISAFAHRRLQALERGVQEQGEGERP